MNPTPTLYRLKEIRDRHIILQSPTGGMRVVPTEGLTEGVATRDGIKFTNGAATYTVSAEDYDQIKSHFGLPATG